MGSNGQVDGVRGSVRRRWPEAEKARIVQQSLEPGAREYDVARRNGLKAQQLSFDGLRVFLHDGRVEIDSNAVENSIRPLALNRKNALFAGHDEGATAVSGQKRPLF